MLTRWEPFTLMEAEFNRLREEMDRLFRRFGGDGWGRVVPEFPAVNIWEEDNDLFVEAEVPGLKLEDLEIYVSQGNQLTIKGKRTRPEVEGTWHRQERGYGEFSRVIALPVDVDADKVEATLKHGVLTIRLPKVAEARVRKITVKAD